MPETDSTTITLGGRVRRLRYTNRSLSRLDEHKDRIARGANPVNMLAIMVLILLDEPNPRETVEDIAALLPTDTGSDEWEVIGEAVSKVSPWERGGKARGKPKTKKKRGGASK